MAEYDITKINAAQNEADKLNRDSGSIQGLKGINTVSSNALDYIRQGQKAALLEQSSPNTRFTGERYAEAVDYNFSRYDDSSENVADLTDMNAVRADAQPGVLKAGSAIIGGALSGLATAVETTAYTTDWLTEFARADEIDESVFLQLAEAMRESKAAISREMPIYERPGDNVAEQVFKWNSLKSIIDSAIGFAIPGGAISKGAEAAASMLGAGAKAAIASQRTAYIIDKFITPSIGVGASALATNYGEGMSMAMAASDEVSEEYINNYAAQYIQAAKEMGQPISLQDAKKLGAEVLANDENAQMQLELLQEDIVNRNKIMAVSNLFALRGIIKNSNFRNSLLKSPTAKKAWLEQFNKLSSANPILQAATEGLEEGTQAVMTEDATFETRKKLGFTSNLEEEIPVDLWDRVVKYAASKDVLTEAIIGFASGPLQSAGAKLTSNVLSGDPLSKKYGEQYAQEYSTQQAWESPVEEDVRKIAQGIMLKDLADATNDTIASNKMQREMFVNTYKKAATEGRAPLFVSLMEDVEQATSDPTERNRISDLRKLAEAAENKLLFSIGDKETGGLRFDNELDKLIHRATLDDIQTALQEVPSEINEEIKDSGETASLTINKGEAFYEIKQGDNTKSPDVSPELKAKIVDYTQRYADTYSELQEAKQVSKDLNSPTKRKAIKEAKRQAAAKKAYEDFKKSAEPMVDADVTYSDAPDKKVKVVNDGGVLYLREFDEDSQAYITPLVTNSKDEELPMTQAQLDKLTLTLTAPPSSTIPVEEAAVSEAVTPPIEPIAEPVTPSAEASTQILETPLENLYSAVEQELGNTPVERIISQLSDRIIFEYNSLLETNPTEEQIKNFFNAIGGQLNNFPMLQQVLSQSDDFLNVWTILNTSAAEFKSSGTLPTVSLPTIANAALRDKLESIKEASATTIAEEVSKIDREELTPVEEQAVDEAIQQAVETIVEEAGDTTNETEETVDTLTEAISEVDSTTAKQLIDGVNDIITKVPYTFTTPKEVRNEWQLIWDAANQLPVIPEKSIQALLNQFADFYKGIIAMNEADSSKEKLVTEIRDSIYALVETKKGNSAQHISAIMTEENYPMEIVSAFYKETYGENTYRGTKGKARTNPTIAWYGSRGVEYDRNEVRITVPNLIRWYDFLNSGEALNYKGELSPMIFEGKTAVRIAIVDGNGKYLTSDGIVDTFSEDTCIWSTMPDITSNSAIKEDTQEVGKDYKDKI